MCTHDNIFPIIIRFWSYYVPLSVAALAGESAVDEEGDAVDGVVGHAVARGGVVGTVLGVSVDARVHRWLDGG